MGRVAHNVKSWEEYQEEVQAIYNQAGKPWTVIGYVGEWKGNTTKIVAHCADHGEWKSTSINHAKNGGGCRYCGIKASKQNKLIDDSIYIEAFIKASPDNIKRKYFPTDDSLVWIVECSKCGEDEYCKAGLCDNKFKSDRNSLKKGSLPCRCSWCPHYTPEQWTYRMKKACKKQGYTFIRWKDENKIGSGCKILYVCPLHGQQEATSNNIKNGRGCPGCKNRNMQEFYINVILDEYGEDTGAYKLGIAKDSDKRLKIQNMNNNYTMQRVALFDLPSYQDCSALENLLKSREVVPSIGNVERLHMKDGASETFLRADLAIVLSAINQAGGVMRK